MDGVVLREGDGRFSLIRHNTRVYDPDRFHIVQITSVVNVFTAPRINRNVMYCQYWKHKCTDHVKKILTIVLIE